MKTKQDPLAQLARLKTDTFGKDFLLTWEKTDDEIKALAIVAERLSELHRQKKSLRVFDAGLALSIFRDNSTRTRFSFASAVNALGLGLAELDEEKSQRAHGETVRETANMISFLAEAIGIRDDHVPGRGQPGHARGRACGAGGLRPGGAPPAPDGRQSPVRHRPPDADHGRPDRT